MNAPFAIGVTGASGALYAARLLQVLTTQPRSLHVVFSPSGLAVIKQELQLTLDPVQDGIEPLLNVAQKWWPKSAVAVEKSPDIYVHAHGNMLAPIASGSFLTSAMVICPCSGGTLSSVVHSASGNLIHRAAEVHLKERRKLILVTRETPLSTPQLENMCQASRYGAVVLPASPGFYHGAQSIPDLVDFVVARICDQLAVPHALSRRWGETDHA